MSHIYIKGNRWYIAFRWHGRLHHFLLHVPASTSRRQVQRLQQKIEYELAMGTFDPKVLKGKIGSETTLYDFLDQLKEYYKKNQRKFSYRTLDDYLYSIKLLKIKRRAIHIKNTKVFWEIANRYAVDSAWKYFRSKTKIQGSFRQLRKTYASYYMMAGGKLSDLQEILGHEDPATVRIYAALSPEHLQKSKDLVGF